MDEPIPAVEAPAPQTDLNHSKQSKAVIYLLLIIIMVLIMGLIALVYYFNNRTPEFPIVNQPTTSITSTPTTTQAKVEGISMEEFIKTECSDISPVKHLLPLRFNPNPIFSNTQNLSIVCGGDQASVQGAIFISNGLNESLHNSLLYIYDGTSTELGHGGYPFIGPAGIKFFSDSSYDYYAFVPVGLGPLSVEGVHVYLRIIKTMTQSNGKKMYVSFSTVLIPTSDNRITEFTKPYLKEVDSVEFGKVMSVNDEEKYTSDLINHFLGDLNNLQEPEKTEFGKIIQLLDSVTNK